MRKESNSDQSFTTPSFAPAGNSAAANPGFSAADLHDLFSTDFMAFVPTARELTMPSGSRAVDSGAAGGAPMNAMALQQVKSLLQVPQGRGAAGAAGGKDVALGLGDASSEALNQGSASGSRASKRRRGGDSDGNGDVDGVGAGAGGSAAAMTAGEEDAAFSNLSEMASGDQKMERRIRNREHAKRSRLRKRFLLESLQSQLTELRKENISLREVIKRRLPAKSQAILASCTEMQSDLLEDLDDEAKERKPRVALPNDTPEDTANGSGVQRQLVEQDYRLIRSLQFSQQCFAISDPALPDNPIVYASQGFLNLTGYSMRQVLGRNCRFLQGPGTDQRSVQEIRDGIAEGRDVTVCLLNYKADGTPFWNQFFIAPLRAADGSIVNFVGVQCEVTTNESIQQRVKKIKYIEHYVDEK